MFDVAISVIQIKRDSRGLDIVMVPSPSVDRLS